MFVAFSCRFGKGELFTVPSGYGSKLGSAACVTRSLNAKAAKAAKAEEKGSKVRKMGPEK
jgi:hypothetical protein